MNPHEPECPIPVLGGLPDGETCFVCPAIRAAYRRGYNDHARSQQHWQDTHGAYRPVDEDPSSHQWRDV